MCGLVGVAGSLGIKEEKAFKLLLELDTIRGYHSTGILFVSKFTGSTEVVKDLGTPWDLYDKKSCQTAFAGAHQVLLGHNRWATKGGVNKWNAHPFEFDKVIGAHNGTLVNQSLLKDHKMFDVDSENLYHHMNEKGLDDTLMHTHGAFALTWYNKQEQSLNLVRNKERPLFIVFSKDNNTVFWASESWMLTVALSKNGIEYKDIFELPLLEHWKVCLDKGEIKDIQITKDKEVYQEPAPKFLPNYGSAGAVNRSSNGTLHNHVNKEKTFCFKDVDLATSNRVYASCRLVDDPSITVRVYKNFGGPKWDKLKSGTTFTGYINSYSYLDGGYLVSDIASVEPCEGVLYKTYAGHMMNEPAVKYCLRVGCITCGQPTELKDVLTVTWLEHNDYMCQSCTKDIEDFNIKHNQH